MVRQSRRKRDRGREPNIDPIHFAVGLQVKMRRELCPDWDDEKIRVDIIEQAEDALEGDGDVTVMTDQGEMEMTDMVGLFRMMFNHMGADRHDPRTQKVLFAQIEKTIAEILAV
jgi:hypothetical protein